MSKAVNAERERQFWDRYIKILNDQGVMPPSDRWHVVWAERYIRAFPGRHLADHSAETVSGYLVAVGKQGDLQAWQYRQAVVAIRLRQRRPVYHIGPFGWARPVFHGT